MQELEDKVAVVTGAASGIGCALAQRFVDEGMRVVAADIEESALEDTADALRKRGGTIATHVTDVADAASVDALADACDRAFGACHVLCNNAGVLSGGVSWEIPLEDWQWVLGVNLCGVVHESPSSPTHDLVLKSTEQAARHGLPPSVMADRVVEAIRDERFYVLSEGGGEPWRAMADTRCQDILAARNPTPGLPVDPQAG